MLIDEEIYWKQRLRVDQLREGDKNTNFFPFESFNKEEKKKYGVLKILKGSGQKIEEK